MYVQTQMEDLRHFTSCKNENSPTYKNDIRGESGSYNS